MALCVTAQVDLKVAWQQRMCIQSLFQHDHETANSNKTSHGELRCQAAGDPVYWLGFAGVRAWINSHIYSFMTNVITHPYHKFNGGKAIPSLNVYRIIYGLPWITIFITSDSAMIVSKIIAEPPHERQRIIIHGNPYISLFLAHYLMLLTHKFAENKHRSFIPPLSWRTIFSNITQNSDLITVDLWRHENASTNIITPYSSIGLARANWLKVDLH